MCITTPGVWAGACRAGRDFGSGAAMFLFYFNKLGLAGSILLSLAVTAALVLAFRMVSG
jgi:hypothetical protein